MTRNRLVFHRCVRGLLACLVGAAALLVCATESAAQGCSTRASTPSALAVFDRPPEATTGRGFVYGRQVFTIPAQSVFYTCKEITAGFGLVTERWVQVAVWLPEKQWLYGWVRAEQLETGRPAPKPQPALLPLISPALAAGAPGSEPGPSGAMAVPPGPPALKLPESEMPSPPPATGEEASMTVSSMLLQAQFVLMLSVAVLLGILAQAAYDLLGSEERITGRRALRLFLRPLLVAPIVLLIFLGTVDLSISQWKQALILALLAFQAGFCWQKSLERAGSQSAAGGGK